MSILFPPSGAGGADQNFQQVAMNPLLASYTRGSLFPTDDAVQDFVGREGLCADGATVIQVAASLIYEPGGVYVAMDPGGNNGDQGYFEGKATHRASYGYDCWVKFHTNASVADRHLFWIGFVSQAATAITSGDPGNNHAALVFEDADSNFQFVSRGNTGQEGTNTLVAPVADTPYYIRIAVVESLVTFVLYDEDLAELASASHSVAFPSALTSQRFVCLGMNQGVSAARFLGLYFAQITNGTQP